MKTIYIQIRNPKNGLFKNINTSNMKRRDMDKTFKFYHKAQYQIRIILL